MIVLSQLAGVVSLALVGIGFLLGELTGRLIVIPLIHIVPGRRESILRVWVHIQRDFTLMAVRWVGGARFDVRARVPCEGGILIVANHQSLLDIPVIYSVVPDGYPRMVARARYARGVPAVSLAMRLCGGIIVRPGKTGRADLDALTETGRGAGHPIVIFPEGHRTRDGEIRPWKRAGLEAFLAAREWTVHVIVLDGLWRTARIPDFVRNLSRVRCRVESAGSFHYDGRGRQTHDEFVDHLQQTMCAKLAAMRREDVQTAPREPARANAVTTS